MDKRKLDKIWIYWRGSLLTQSRTVVPYTNERSKTNKRFWHELDSCTNHRQFVIYLVKTNLKKKKMVVIQIKNEKRKKKSEEKREKREKRLAVLHPHNTHQMDLVTWLRAYCWEKQEATNGSSGEDESSRAFRDIANGQNDRDSITRRPCWGTVLARIDRSRPVPLWFVDSRETNFSKRKMFKRRLYRIET